MANWECGTSILCVATIPTPLPGILAGLMPWSWIPWLLAQSTSDARSLDGGIVTTVIESATWDSHGW